MTHSPAAEDPAPRSSYRLMLDRRVGPFILGKMLSSCGIWMQSIVASLLVFELTGSATMVGLVTAAQFAPQLLLGPLSGRLADSGNAPLQIALGRFLMGAANLGLALWILAAGGTGHLGGATPVLVASLAMGIGSVLGAPAMQSVLPRMVRPGEVSAIVALSSLPTTGGRAVGPVVAVWLMVTFGAEAALVAAAGCAWFFAAVVLLLRIPSPPRRPRDAGSNSFMEGVRFVRGNRTVALGLLGVTSVAISSEPVSTLGPSLAVHLDAGSAFVGWIGSAFGVGAALGFVLCGPLTRRGGDLQAARAGLLSLAAGLTTAALSPEAWVAVAGFTLCGIGMTLALTGFTTLMQTGTPTHLLGRVMSLWSVGYLGARPLASALMGAVTDLAHVVVALAMTTLATLTVLVLTRRRR